MLGIILFILKLLGILLLVILGIVVLVLALVLFAPVKYSGKGSKYGDELKVQALITYLNPIVRVKVQYPGEKIVQLKICGFTVFSTGKESNEKEKNEKPEEKAKEKDKPSFESDSKTEQECTYQGSAESSKEKEEGSPQQSSVAAAGEQAESNIDSIQKDKAEKSEAVCRQSDVSQDAADQASGAAESETASSDIRGGHSGQTGAKQTAGSEHVQEEQNSSKSSVLDTVQYYASLLQENKGLILNVIKTVLSALKTILPGKCRIKAVFGTGEADTTGFIYAAYCALDGFLPGEIIFEPVWTEKFAEGEFELKGRIRVIHFVAAAIKIIANKDVRLLIKKIRRV